MSKSVVHKKRFRQEHKGRRFVEAPFLVNALLATIAIVISIRTCYETASVRRLDEMRAVMEFSEDLAASGHVRMIADREFDYLAQSFPNDTALSFVPAIADFAITNNSRQAVSILQVNYAQFGCIGDTICLPCVTDRNGPTKRKYKPPIDLQPGQSVCLEDTLYICIPGYHTPYVRWGGDSLLWLALPISADLAAMSAGAQVYAPLVFGDRCFKPERSFLRCGLLTSRNTEFSFSYFLFIDSLGSTNSSLVK